MTRSSRFLLPFALIALAASLAVGVPRAAAIDPFPTTGVATLASDHFRIHFSRDVAPCPTAAITQEQAGEILGMVSYPDFDPNDTAKTPLSNTLNRSAASVFEMGSIFKVFSFSAGLDSGSSLRRESAASIACSRSTRGFSNSSW